MYCLVRYGQVISYVVFMCDPNLGYPDKENTVILFLLLFFASFVILCVLCVKTKALASEED